MGLEAQARLREEEKGLFPAAHMAPFQKLWSLVSLSYLLGGPAPLTLALG